MSTVTTLAQDCNVRSSQLSSFMHCPHTQERTAAEKRALVDELFDRYAAAVAKAPGDHGMDYVHAFMVIEKV